MVKIHGFRLGIVSSLGRKRSYPPKSLCVCISTHQRTLVRTCPRNSFQTNTPKSHGFCHNFPSISIKLLYIGLLTVRNKSLNHWFPATGQRHPGCRFWRSSSNCAIAWQLGGKDQCERLRGLTSQGYEVVSISIHISFSTFPIFGRNTHETGLCMLVILEHVPVLKHPVLYVVYTEKSLLLPSHLLLLLVFQHLSMASLPQKQQANCFQWLDINPGRWYRS